MPVLDFAPFLGSLEVMCENNNIYNVGTIVCSVIQTDRNGVGKVVS